MYSVTSSGWGSGISSIIFEVVLNGLQQEPGSGKDYSLSGTTVTFAIAPVC